MCVYQTDVKTISWRTGNLWNMMLRSSANTQNSFNYCVHAAYSHTQVASASQWFIWSTIHLTHISVMKLFVSFTGLCEISQISCSRSSHAVNETRKLTAVSETAGQDLSRGAVAFVRQFNGHLDVLHPLLHLRRGAVGAMRGRKQCSYCQSKHWRHTIAILRFLPP